MKVLIIGASGVLGGRLYKDTIKKGWETHGTFYSYKINGLVHLDVRDKKALARVFEAFEPDTVIMAGGITDVDLCEARPHLAEDVNIRGVLNTIEKAKEINARLVFLSTDYVFNGETGPYKEDDEPSPINVYGKTKLEAELAVDGLLRDSLIVRTAQIYGIDARGRNFTSRVISSMKQGKKVLAATDLYCTPTYTVSLSDAIIKLLEKGKSGIYHVAGLDFIDRYSYVGIIADVFNLGRPLIEAVKLKDLHLEAPRPYKAGLRTDKVKRETDALLLSCSDGVKMLKKEML